MDILVAGAGAGKTTKMASKIIEYSKEQSSEKMIFCLAFTNNAVDRIRGMLRTYYGVLPKNVHVQTIHSFLIQEFIFPYYFIMYGIHYEKFSKIKLPDNPRSKNYTLSKLEKNGILHVSVVPQRAMWIVDKKSGDRKKQKQIRKNILKAFSEYCSGIFIDEAQDINEEMRKVLSVLDNNQIPLFLMGDPKQDVKGHGSFRKLISNNQSVQYASECHRCPQLHIKLSNSIVVQPEKQHTAKENGTISYAYENEFSSFTGYELVYISRKTSLYDTHDNMDNGNLRFHTIEYELYEFFRDMHPEKSKDTIGCLSYYYTEKMLSDLESGKEASKIITDFSNIYGRFEKSVYAKIINALVPLNTSAHNIIRVSSIESIKGQEAEQCLFILTTDLAPYLFKDNEEDNKTKNLLYVALTRSLNHLTILVTKDVEKKYGRLYINQFFSNFEIENISS